MTHYKNILIFSFFLISCQVFATNVAIYSNHGDRFLIEVNKDDSIETIKNRLDHDYGIPQDLQSLYSENRAVSNSDLIDDFLIKEFWLEYGDAQEAKPKYPGIRDYWAPTTRFEESDISYVVTTLANKSLPKLWKMKSHIKNVGDRIDHIHTLKFLSYIFSRDQLIVGIRNIRKRGWVWDDFGDGIKNGLKEEWEKDNLTDDLLEDFASVVDIDVEIILPFVQSQNWSGFIDKLIHTVERKGDTGRFDM